MRIRDLVGRKHHGQTDIDPLAFNGHLGRGVEKNFNDRAGGIHYEPNIGRLLVAKC